MSSSSKKETRRIDRQPRAEKSKTNALELIDDCLQDIFGHLDLLDLCTVADVCTRFRENAKLYFAKKEYKDINLNRAYDEEGMLGLCKVLRNTGPLAEFVRMQLPPSTANEREEEIGTAIIELISLHCNERARIILKHFRVEDELIETLPHLVILQIEKSDSTKAQINGELEELIQDIPQTINVSAVTGLEKLSLNLLDLDHEIFEKALENNPDLKKIELIYCRNIDDRIFPLIAAKAPQIESLRFA